MPLRYLLFSLLLAFALSACASAPKRGVRVQFQGNKVARIAVAPIWKSSTFGMSADEFEAFTNQLQRQLVADLEELGFTVVTPDQLRDRLERANGYDRFIDVISFVDEIDRYFEPSLYDEPPLEVIALKELDERGALGAPTLLVSELVYQSTAQCATDPREFNRFAIVRTPAGDAPRKLQDSPCVVTHFHAKLVDAATGKTMWQNRQLIEYRASSVRPSDAQRNANSTVKATVLGPHGLGPFSPQRNAM